MDHQPYKECKYAATFAGCERVTIWSIPTSSQHEPAWFILLLATTMGCICPITWHARQRNGHHRMGVLSVPRVGKRSHVPSVGSCWYDWTTRNPLTERSTCGFPTAVATPSCVMTVCLCTQTRLLERLRRSIFPKTAGRRGGM